MPVDVQALDCDFYVFSGPQGVRADRHRRASSASASVLEAMPPWQGGGNMIEDVTFERTIYQPPPRALRGRAPATSPTPSASAPRSTT